MPKIFLHDVFSLLLQVTLAIDNILTKTSLSDEKKLAKRVLQFSEHLRVIIDNAEMIFKLIQTADKQVIEYGEDKFTQIIKEHFKTQSERITELLKKILEPEMSSILENIDNNIRKQLSDALYFKRDRIYIALNRMGYSNLEVYNDELFVLQKGERIPFVSQIEEGLLILSEIKRCSKSIWNTISARINLSDLKKIE